MSQCSSASTGQITSLTPSGNSSAGRSSTPEKGSRSEGSMGSLRRRRAPWRHRAVGRWISDAMNDDKRDDRRVDAELEGVPMVGTRSWAATAATHRCWFSTVPGARRKLIGAGGLLELVQGGGALRSRRSYRAGVNLASPAQRERLAQ